MNRFRRHSQKDEVGWRLAVVIASVVVLHATGVWWWMSAQAGVAGAGSGASTHGVPFRARTTVWQEVLIFGAATDKTPLRSIDEAQRQTTLVVLPQLQTEPLAGVAQVPTAGADHVWSPMPSDYLSDEQVDVFPRPKGDWMLDWAQIPLTREAWRVTVRIWVSASGLVDHVETLEAQPAEPWVAKLLAPLVATEMEPATLAGQPVPVTYVVQLAPDQLQ